MNLFKKASDSVPAKAPEVQPQPMNENLEGSEEKLTPLETVKSIFKTRFGEDMPDDMLSRFKALVTSEAQLLVNSFNRLDTQEIDKIEEALHLSDTKRKSVIRQIAQIDSQLEWYDDFVLKTRDLNDKKKVLYEAQNAMAETYTESQLLERFDALSPIRVLYHQIQKLESDLKEQETMRGELAAQVEEWQQTVNQKSKEYADARQSYKSVEQDMEDKLTVLRTNYELNGQTSQLQKEIMDSQLIQQQLTQNLNEARKRELECNTQLLHLREQHQKAEDILQTLEPYQQMLVHGEMILVKLDNLHSLKFAVDADQQQYDEWQKKQSDSNETLNRLFRDNQENESELQTAKSEMSIHQQSIKGTDGLSLQKRVSDLAGQSLRLKTAQGVWKRISEGYDFIENKKDEIMRQQLQFDNQTEILAKQQQKVSKLKSVYNEQNYASTLSKSENVTSLRRDLREGSSCSVCGATHHPYHSETEQALNELVNNLEAEARQTQEELDVENANLLKMQLEHSLQEGILSKNKEMLENAILQTDSDKNAWMEFANLDATFSDCSPSVNRQTRRIVIQQLVERTSQDLEDARKELDMFNFHQASINSMVDHIEVLEGKKRDNSVRLTEVNTACQVLANNTDFMQKTLSNRKADYHQLYEELSHLITLPGWHSEWLQNSENCKIRLQTMMSDWEQNSRIVATCNEEEKLQKGILDTLGDFIKLYDVQLTQITQSLEAMNETLDEKQADMRRSLGEMPLDDALSTLMSDARKAMQNMTDVGQQLTVSQHTLDLFEGRMKEQGNLRVEQEKQLVQKRSELDLWLRKFNATHAPAQPSELKRLFDGQGGWGELRQRVEEIKKHLFLAEHDVSEARRLLSEHQAKSLRPDDSEDESRDALTFRKDKLKEELESLYFQHASLEARLESNRLSGERMEQYEKDIAKRLE